LYIASHALRDQEAAEDDSPTASTSARTPVPSTARIRPISPARQTRSLRRPTVRERLAPWSQLISGGVQLPA
jgi:hypothetical protein